MLIYLAVNAAYLHVLAIGEMAGSQLVAADVAVRLLGRAGAAAIAALVCVSTFGTLNGGLLVFPRVFFAMADDGLFFRKVAAVHPRFRTPHVAIALTAAMAIAYLSLRSFEQLIEISILGQLPFWALGIGAVLVLRRSRPGLPRPYRTPGFPIVPLLFIAIMVALLVNSLAEHPGIHLLDPRGCDSWHPGVFRVEAAWSDQGGPVSVSRGWIRSGTWMTSQRFQESRLVAVVLGGAALREKANKMRTLSHTALRYPV